MAVDRSIENARRRIDELVDRIEGIAEHKTETTEVLADLTLVAEGLRKRADDLYQENKDAIADREKLEASLRASEVQLRKALEFDHAVMTGMAEGLYAVDLNGIVTYMNPAAERFLGWPQAELLGRKIHELVHYQHPDGSPFPAEECPALRVMQSRMALTDFEDVFIRKEGTFFPVTISSSPIASNSDVLGAVVVFRDISARKRGQEALRESEARFKAIFNAAQDAIVLVDDSAACTQTNPATQVIFGPAMEHCEGQSIAPLLEAAGDFSATWSQFLREGCFRRTIRMTRLDGRLLVVEVYGVASVVPRRHLFVFRDKTEREVFLKEHETQHIFLDNLIAAAPIGITALEAPSLRYIMANPCYKSICGLDEHADITGQTFGELLPGVQKPTHIQALKRACVTGEPLAVKEAEANLGPGRERTWWNVRIMPLKTPDGRIDRLLLLLDEVTEQVLIREKMAEDERRERIRAAELSAIMEAVPALMWISRDPACLTMTGNRAVYELLRMPDRANVSESIRDRAAPRCYTMCKNGKPVPAKDLPMQRAAALNQEIRDYEFDIVFDEGPILHLFGNAAPLHDENGNVRGAVGIFMNITLRKQHEERLTILADELARSNKDLEQFAYVASHDLQEPLRQVVGFSELIEKRYQAKLDVQGTEFLNFIIEGSRRMQNLIRDLLSYSRVGRKEEQRVRLPLQDVLNGALKNLRARIEESGAVITNDPMPTLAVIAPRLEQLFQNLISNALKFKGEEKPKIHVGARPEDAQWLFWIRDNGIGFKQEDAGRLFQVFQRLHTRKEYEGTGIGLAICQRVVELHGGKIWAESEPGKGATFYFTLSV